MLPLFAMYAMFAGVFAAGSAFVGKLSVTGDREIFWLFRILLFGSNAFFTAQMWRYYLKSLQMGPTGLCSIVNTGTNFAVSAFLGITFFGEVVNWVWWLGALLCCLGLSIAVTEEGEQALPSGNEGGKHR